MVEKITRDQFRIFVKSMKAVYTSPGFLPDDDAAEVWYTLLKDLDYRVITWALQKHMMTSPYPPTIADLRKQASEFQPSAGVEHMSELAAWELVRRAISNSSYHAEEEYARLPELVQKAVGNPANLREMASMDIETVNSVEQSHFIRAFRTVVDREKELNQLNPGMRFLIDQISAGGADILIEEEEVHGEELPFKG